MTGPGDSEEKLAIEEVEKPSRLPGPGFSPEEHRAKTTKQLAFLFFAALFIVFAAHVMCVFLLAHERPDSVDQITRVFNIWVPVFSGLVGAAATFYFTQTRR